MLATRRRVFTALASFSAALVAGTVGVLYPAPARSAAIASPVAPDGRVVPKSCGKVPRFRSVDRKRDAHRRGTFATRVPGWSRDVWVSVPLAAPPAKGWPLIVALWGTGSTGERLCSIVGLETLAYDVPAILVAPTQDGDYRNRSDESAARIAREAALDRFHVDRSHVSIFGSSLGGWEVWRTLAEEPEPWAAGAVYAAGAPPAVWVDRMLRHTTPPLYLYVGENDRSRLAGMREAYAKLFELEREVEFHIMEGWDHGPPFSWQRREYLDKVFPFLLAHELKPVDKS